MYISSNRNGCKMFLSTEIFKEAYTITLLNIFIQTYIFRIITLHQILLQEYLYSLRNPFLLDKFLPPEKNKLHSFC